MEKDYRNMGNNDLKALMKEMESEFNENQFLIKQAYERMAELSVDYEKIKAVLKERNADVK